ncbi:hypothetical protein [Shimazuella alba]|uniref:Uncharacterized protein n=1 Tax=Shimazuella alba TaxID=2690964 RepID=A0A6I4VXW5_9BACL|nr:hypothetical protein [Shimazuella alba]MXQ55571.1 hypothetical protein [Shimazuella alba]
MATSLDPKTCREITNKLREGSRPLKDAAAVFHAMSIFSAEFAKANLGNFVFPAWDSLTRKDIEILDEVTKMAGLQHPE